MNYVFLSELIQFAGEVIREHLLLLLVVERQGLFLLLECLNLLEECIRNKLLFLLGLGLDVDRRLTQSLVFFLLKT